MSSYPAGLNDTKHTSELPVALQNYIDNKPMYYTSEEQLDALEWAKNFMNNYERKYNVPRISNT